MGEYSYEGDTQVKDIGQPDDAEDVQGIGYRPEIDEDEEEAPDNEVSNLNAYLEMINIAEEIDDKELNGIGEWCSIGYEIDKKTRS